MLEFSHRLDATIQNDEVTGLCINPGAHEMRGACDDGIGGLRIDEVIELGLAFRIISGDTHDIPGIGSSQIGIGVDQRLPHAIRMILILTEDDSLVETVSRPEKPGDLCRNGFRPTPENEVTVIVTVVVFAVFDDVSIAVSLPVFGPPTVKILVQSDTDHFVGCEKPVFYPFAERIRVNGIPEILAVGCVASLLGSGC
ncbi:MAG: hypothetical protein BWY82_02406 [Verrucomicrobia bacterium ADurb.Bin474]|nr:MAG: hypothetical protein BWY82_02406 [Verrucomicrobia bacterium ADurb.Bin474]